MYVVDGDGSFGEPHLVSLQVNGGDSTNGDLYWGSSLHNSRKSAPRAVSIVETTENQGMTANLYCRADDSHGYYFCEKVKYKNQSRTLSLFVVKTDGPTLLG